MIIKFIFEILMSIIGFIIGLFGDIGNSQFTGSVIVQFLNLLADFMQFGINFIYFTVGEAWQELLTLGIGLLTLRYFIYPIVVIVRRVFIKGGDT